MKTLSGQVKLEVVVENDEHCSRDCCWFDDYQCRLFNRLWMLECTGYGESFRIVRHKDCVEAFK